MTSNAARPAPFTPIRGFRAIGSIRQPAWRALSAARGESLAAFDERCIPKPPQRGCRVGGPGASGVAPPSNTPGIATPPRKPRAAGAPVLSRRALPAGRLARLGAAFDESSQADVTVSGSIVDESAGVIPGATVNLLRQNSATRSTTSKADGTFGFEGVAPGTYVLRAEIAGFEMYQPTIVG